MARITLGVQPVAFPINCTNAGDRTEFLYRTKELLRLWHNEQGAKVRRGDMTQAQWQDWLERVYYPQSNEVGDQILEQRRRMEGRDLSYTPRFEPADVRIEL